MVEPVFALMRMIGVLDETLDADQKAWLCELPDAPESYAQLHFSLGIHVRNHFIHGGNAARYGLSPLATRHADDFSAFVLGCYLRHVRGEDPLEGALASLRERLFLCDDGEVMQAAVSLLGPEEAARQAVRVPDPGSR